MREVWAEMPDVQEKAEAHLAACYEAMDAYEDGDLTAESPAYAPFDGCHTCDVREVIMVVFEEMMLRVGEPPLDRVMSQVPLDGEGNAVCDEPRPSDDRRVDSPPPALRALDGGRASGQVR